MASEIERLEDELLRVRALLREARKASTRRPFGEQTLVGWDGPVTLSQLFGGSPELLVWHNMGQSCPYCTLWADVLTGYFRHLESRCPVVVVTPDPPAAQKQLAARRGWNFKMVQDSTSVFSREAGFYGEHDGKMMFFPGLSAFCRDPDGHLSQANRTFFGPGDQFCPVWPALELLPGGAADWEPS